jgi:carboxypeptidase C (cathepsin A)
MIARRVALLSIIAATAANAQTDTIAGVQTPIATTTHRITLRGNPFAYTARAGMLPIRHNDDGLPRAYVFFVAYTVNRAPGAPPRPLTFTWNGGPGANSLLLHLSALGPRRLADEGKSLAFEDNQATWLDDTDLVFVDPVGTGFSRPAKPEFAQDFYGVLGDIAATREFIRTYRTRFDAWDQPVYLAGESYGTWRAAGTAEAMEKEDETVTGIILISGGIPLGPLLTDPMRAATFLPTRTASAHYHKKLPPDLQQRSREQAAAEAERWGKTVYGPALARVDSLTPNERANIVANLSRFTGLDTSTIDKQTLIVDRQFLIDNLLKDRNQGSLGRFDTRQIGGTGGGDAARGARRRLLINRYLRTELGFKTDLVYQGLENGYHSTAGARGPAARWKYDQGPPGVPLVVRNTDGPPGGTPPWVRRAITLNPNLRVMVAAGLFDSLNSCTANEYVITLLEPQVRDNITLGCYEGGHMMYEDTDARFRLDRDATRFYRSTPR